MCTTNLFVCLSSIELHAPPHYNFVYLSFCPPIPKRGWERDRTTVMTVQKIIIPYLKGTESQKVTWCFRKINCSLKLCTEFVCV